VKKRVGLILGIVLLFSVFSIFVFADGEVCCNYPGPADEPLYEWRASETECQSPENALFGDRIVEDYFCEDDFDGDLQACVDDCKSQNPNEERRGQCIKECKEKRGFDDDFEDDPNYRCEDMNKYDCESAKDCEGIFGPSFCEGDVCTADMAWQGCRFKGDEFFEEYEDEELKQEAGTTPGDNFYFIDKFFDKFVGK